MENTEVSNYWNYFRFFEPATVDLNIFEEIKFTCTASGHGVLCIADHEDFYLRDKSGEIKPYSFKNMEIIRVLLANSDPTMLVFCQDLQSYTIYYLNTSNFDQLSLITFSKAIHQTVGSITALPDNSKIAFVSNENNVVVYSSPYKLNTVPKVFKYNDPVIGLHFGVRHQIYPTLYVLTQKEIFSVSFTEGSAPTQTKIDIRSTDGATTISDAGLLVVSRGKEITRYNEKGIDLTYTIEDTPTLLYSFQDYLVACYGNNEPGSVLIYHPKTHLVFGKASGGLSIQQIYNVWGYVLFIRRNSTFMFLKPTDIIEKINQLIHNMQFEVAVQISIAKNLPPEFVGNIHYMQGQNYMERSDYQNAVQCYIKTIKRIEPSFIISQFIETSRTEYLIQYLEALNDNRVSTKQHTTLLFNCYTKLRNKEKLTTIINAALEGSKVNREPSFDVDAAIKILLKNNYFNEAMQLSHAFRRYATYLNILIKRKFWSEIINYFHEVDKDTLVNSLREVADILDILPASYRGELIDIILQHCLTKEKNFLKLKYLQRIFTNHREDLYYILRTILQQMPERMEKFNWNMLIELAIEDPVDDDDEIALKYLNDKRANFDMELILIVIAGAKNEHAKQCVLEKAGLLDSLIKIAEIDKIIEICTLYCDKDVFIWERALNVVAKRNDESQLKPMLEMCQKYLTMLEILNCLKGRNIKMGTIKEFMLRHFNEMSQENNKLSEKVDNDLKDLQEKQETEENKRTGFFPTKTAYCDKCHDTLEIPIRHFLCGHSYHLACLGEVIEFCPICHERHKEIVSKREKNLLETDLVYKNEDEPTMDDFVENIASDAMVLTASEDLAKVKQFQDYLTSKDL